MTIFVFGSSILSSYWNGAATYYRGIYKYLHRLGHQITFAEPDVYGRQQHLDSGDYSYVRSLVYAPEEEIPKLIELAAGADLVIKHSGIGWKDAELEAAVLACRDSGSLVFFWDVDAPATLQRVEADPADRFRFLIPEYDAILTYGGGMPVIQAYKGLRARTCRTIYNGLDPETHIPAPGNPAWKSDLAFVGNRLPDRERRVEELFFSAAEQAPQFTFLLGGEGWGDKALPNNMRWIGHVPTAEHNRINSSARMVLNINRDSMAAVGFSPPTRIFEAAGSGACMICDAWPGLGSFFEPGREILVAGSAEDVVRHLQEIDEAKARRIGRQFKDRALRDHTYQSRAIEVDAILRGLTAERDLPAATPFVA